MRWLGVKSSGSAIPTSRELLRLIYLGRMCLAIAIYVTAVVHMTGGADSDLASLYVILVAVTALLMPPANAGLVTVFAGLMYFADVFWGHSGGVTPGIWIQLGVFALVAVVIAYVATRVNVLGRRE